MALRHDGTGFLVAVNHPSSSALQVRECRPQRVVPHGEMLLLVGLGRSPGETGLGCLRGSSPWQCVIYQ